METEKYSRDRPGKSSNLGEKLNTEGKAKKAAGAKLRSGTTAQKAAGEKMRFEKAVFEPEGETPAKGLRPKQQKRYNRKKLHQSRAARLSEGKVRSEIEQESDGNVGVEAANAGAQAAEMAADSAGDSASNAFSRWRQNQVPDFVQEAEAQMAKEAKEGKTAEAPEKREEVTIKFGKGLAEPFTAKDGREFTRIMIPNQDQSDKTPWASFVLPSKAVHENQYGKGLWAKIPAEGTTVVTKPVLKGQDEQGKNIWEDQKTKVPNRELKGMVEAYKAKAPQTRDQKASEPRESAREKLDALVKDTAAKLSPEKTPKAKTKSKKGPEL